MQTLDKVIAFVLKIQQLQQQGWTLKQINKWSYEQREAGEDVIYMSWGTKSKDPNESYLIASPIAKQKEYKKFFSEVAEGFLSFSKYQLYVYESGVIKFYTSVKNPDTKEVTRTCLLTNTLINII